MAVYMKPGPKAVFCAVDDVVAVDVEGTVMVAFIVSIPFAKMLLMFCYEDCEDCEAIARELMPPFSTDGMF